TELCKDENVIWIKSSYGGSRFGFKITEEWKQKYKYLLTSKDKNFKSRYSIILTDYFRLISTCYHITTEHSKNLDINEYHINLLRNTYFDYNIGGGIEEDDDEDYKGYVHEAIFLGYKRPFGNSYVIGDVL